MLDQLLNPLKMLLFLFHLIFMVLAIRPPVKLCIEEGKVKSMESKMINEVLTSNCADFNVVFKGRYNALYLREKNITSFEKGWYRLDNRLIKKIYLERNKIVEITSAMFNELPIDIEELYLRNNSIEFIRIGTLKVEYLTRLDLSFNSISKIENKALRDHHRLENLNLDHNKLKDTKFAATLPTQLRRLYLSSNMIQKISFNSFLKLDKLEILDLGRNKITVIQRKTFEGLDSLKILSLSFNPIKEMDINAFMYTPLLNVVRYDLPEYHELTKINNHLVHYNNGTFFIRNRPTYEKIVPDGLSSPGGSPGPDAKVNPGPWHLDRDSNLNFTVRPALVYFPRGNSELMFIKIY